MVFEEFLPGAPGPKIVPTYRQPHIQDIVKRQKLQARTAGVFDVVLGTGLTLVQLVPFHAHVSFIAASIGSNPPNRMTAPFAAVGAMLPYGILLLVAVMRSTRSRCRREQYGSI